MKIASSKESKSVLSAEEISFFENIAIPACNQRPYEDEIIRFFYDRKLIAASNLNEKTTEELVKEVLRTQSTPLLFVFLKMIRWELSYHFDGRSGIRADEIINRLTPVKDATKTQKINKTQSYKEIIQTLARHFWASTPKMTNTN